MRRREFIAFLGGSMAAWPFTATAQQAVPVIGYLSSRSPAASASTVAAFRRGLSDTGFVDRQSVTVEHRWSEQYHQLAALASELASRKVALIFADDLPSARAAKAATATVPIAFVVGSDPVKAGLTANVNRPGGNITGATFLASRIGTKQVGLLRELAPRSTTVAMLANPENPSAAAEMEDVEMAARSLRLDLTVLPAAAERDIDAGFSTLVRLRADALVVAADPFFHACRDRIIALAARHAVPAIYSARDFPASGGLISYGASITDAFLQAGFYVGRILKGTRSGDLPVLQPTRFELVINLATARTLGLDLPPTLLAGADEVIE
jgi:putative ABC transport system substrate-binding protein